MVDNTPVMGSVVLTPDEAVELLNGLTIMRGSRQTGLTEEQARGLRSKLLRAGQTAAELRSFRSLTDPRPAG